MLLAQNPNHTLNKKERKCSYARIYGVLAPYKEWEIRRDPLHRRYPNTNHGILVVGDNVTRALEIVQAAGIPFYAAQSWSDNTIYIMC